MLLYPPLSISTNDRRDFADGTLYNGDCLEIIKELPAASVDCIITDPPYFLGMTHNGQKGNFRDLSICRPFYRDLFHEFARVAKPEACIYFFCDWRGYAFYYPLFDEILRAHNMLVWNKLSGPGNHYAFIHELVLFHAGKGANIGGHKHNCRREGVYQRRTLDRRREGTPDAETGRPHSEIYKRLMPSPWRDTRHFRRLRYYGRGSRPHRAPFRAHGARRGLLFNRLQAPGR